MKRRVEKFSAAASNDPTIKKCKTTLVKVQFPKPAPINTLFALLLPQFHQPPTTWQDGQDVISQVDQLLREQPQLLDAPDDSDIFAQKNTAAHYLIFFLGSYGTLHPAAFRTFVGLLRLFVLDFGCNICLPNSNGTTVLSFALRCSSVTRCVVCSLWREKVDCEKRIAREFLAHPDPVLARCGLVPDIQRELKLRNMMNKVLAALERDKHSR